MVKKINIIGRTFFESQLSLDISLDHLLETSCISIISNSSSFKASSLSLGVSASSLLIRPPISFKTPASGTKSLAAFKMFGAALDKNMDPCDTRNQVQKEALLDLLCQLKDAYGGVIYGHRDFSTKACPSFDAKTEYQ